MTLARNMKNSIRKREKGERKGKKKKTFRMAGELGSQAAR
jgi:hypothetical protein